MNTETHTSANLQTREDIKNSVLIVSVLVNLTIFITWLVLEASPNLSVALVSRI